VRGPTAHGDIVYSGSTGPVHWTSDSNLAA
jgi:hypothetical protein